jgi:lipoprotein-anchoring transpeptidase ErfK/SrfK
LTSTGIAIGKSIAALATGSCLAAALFVSVTALRGGHAQQSAAAAPVSAPTATGQRLFYPVGRLPRISLPDGRTETIRSVLNIGTPIQYGNSRWDDANVPQGPVWVRIDLTHQLLSVFRAGHEIGTSVILYGAADRQSPTGTFPVLEKAEDYHSRTYDAAMPYSLRLTADGVAIHAADVRRGAATHGCIGVPTDFARRLFAEVKLGDPVVIMQSTS